MAANEGSEDDGVRVRVDQGSLRHVVCTNVIWYGVWLRTRCLLYAAARREPSTATRSSATALYRRGGKTSAGPGDYGIRPTDPSPLDNGNLKCGADSCTHTSSALTGCPFSLLLHTCTSCTHSANRALLAWIGTETTTPD